MGLFGRRSASTPARGVSDASLEMWARIDAAMAAGEVGEPQTVYWVRKPGDEWRIYTLWPGQTFDDLVRIMPDGTEFSLAEGPQ